MATFTTYSALKQQMLDDRASRSIGVKRHRSPTGAEVEYTTEAEWQQAFGFVAAMAEQEAAAASNLASRRSQAVPTSDRW